MPRDSSGLYTLPIGNPVVTNTIISSVWANDTMGDIAAQLNNVITRDGLLGPIGPFKIADGTVNAPGLAFSSEPGLGWFRPSALIVSMAAAGATTFSFNAGTPASTGFFVFPRAAGQSFIHLRRQPSGSADNSGLQLLAAAGASGITAIGANGTTDRVTLNFAATDYGWFMPGGAGGVGATLQGAGVFTAQSLNISGGAVGTWYNSGGDQIFQHASGWYWVWAGANGTLTWVRPGAVPDFTLSADGNVFTGGGSLNTGNGNLNAGNGRLDVAAGMSMVWDGGNANFLSMGGTGTDWRWQWIRTTGQLNWIRHSGAPTTQFGANGDFVAGRDVYTDTANGVALLGHTSTGGNPQVRFTVDGWRLQWTGGILSYFPAGGGGASWWSDGAGNFNTATQGWKPGGGDWANLSSDLRTKDNVEDFTEGLEVILALRPRRFNYKAETGFSPDVAHVGLVAQEVPKQLRRPAPKQPMSDEYDDLETVDTDPIRYQLINSIKTLHERISRIESQAAGA